MKGTVKYDTFRAIKILKGKSIKIIFIKTCRPKRVKKNVNHHEKNDKKIYVDTHHLNLIIKSSAFFYVAAMFVLFISFISTFGFPFFPDFPFVKFLS